MFTNNILRKIHFPNLNFVKNMFVYTVLSDILDEMCVC